MRSDRHSNTCNLARPEYTTWFHNAVCQKNNIYGSGYTNVWQWPGECSDFDPGWYDVPNQSMFAVNNDGAGAGSCSKAEVDGYRWTGSNWSRFVTSSVAKGTNRYWVATARYQHWQIGPVSEQCHPTELFSCMMTK